MKSRKLWLSIALMLVFIFFAFIEKADEIMKVSPALLTIFGFYVTGNVGSKVANKINIK